MNFKKWLRESFGPRVQTARSSRRGKSRQQRRRRSEPALEGLEARLAPAVLMVTSAFDSGTGSLRDAITASVNHTTDGLGQTGTGNDIIQFSHSLDGGTIVLSTSINDATVAGPSAFLIGNHDTLIIDGESGLTQGITIARNQAGAPFRLFDVDSTGSLVLEGLTLSGGLAAGGDGGGTAGVGVSAGAGGGGAAGMGGAIFNAGNLTILDSTLTGNTAQGGAGGYGSLGGAGASGGGGLGGAGVNPGYSSEGGAGGGPNGGSGGTISADPGGAGGDGGGGGGGAGFVIVFSFEGSGGQGGFGGGGGGGGTNHEKNSHQGASGGMGGFGGGGGGAGYDAVLAGAGYSAFGGGRGGQGGYKYVGFQGFQGSGGGGGGGGAGMGGALFNRAGTVVITNSTFAANSAIGGAGGGSSSNWPKGPGTAGAGLGGGLFNYNGSLTVTNSTISENRSDQGGRGIYNLGDGLTSATATISNTIIGQSDTNVSDLAVNTINGGSASVSGQADLIRTISGATLTSLTGDPKLGPLQDNGGRTPTMAPLAGSPVIDNGIKSLAPTLDQRGFLRDPDGAGTVDIGAVERINVVAHVIVNTAADEITDPTVLSLRQAFDLFNGTLQYLSLTPQQKAQVTLGTADDAVSFDSSLNGSTIVLSTVGDHRVGPSAFLVDGEQVTINGPGGNSGIALAAGTRMRLFDVTSSGQLTLQNLTLEGGDAQGFAGGNTKFGGGGGGSAGLGGAIFNQGTLRIANSTLTGNTAQGGAGGGYAGYNLGEGGGGGGLGAPGRAGVSKSGGDAGGPHGGFGGNLNFSGTSGGFGGGGGGGYYDNDAGTGGFGAGGGGAGYTYFPSNIGAAGGGGFGGGGGGGAGRSPRGIGGYGGGAGAATVPNLSSNYIASGGGGGGAGMGGAVFNEAGTVQITNSTFTANSAIGGAAGGDFISTHPDAGQGLGGGLFNHNGSITVTNSTFSNNTAAQGGRGIFNLGDSATASATINNTIIGQSDTTGQDFTGKTNGTGIDLTSGSGDLIRTQSGFAGFIAKSGDPMLAGLASNGGPTQTMALMTGSSAINAGNASLAPSTDQRGFTRDSQPDIGAFEYGAQVITFNPILSPVTFGVAPITLSATSTSGLPVTFRVVSGRGTINGNTLTVTGAGNIVVEADQTGNANFNAAPAVQQTLVVNKASAVIVITPYTSATTLFTGSGHTATGTATGVGGANLNSDLILTGTTHTNSGTYTDTWSFHDPAGNYVDASGTIHDSIAPTALGAAALVEGPAAGSDADFVISGGAWTATSNASWLHTSASGTGKGPAKFSFDANTGPTRTGTLTIAGLTVSVTQAGLGYVAVNPFATLVSSGLNFPQGMAMDASGNIYIADAGDNAIKEWKAATKQVVTLVSSGLNIPQGVAVDGSGNVYIADTFNNAIKEWNATTQQVTTLPISGLFFPQGVAVDGSGNVFIADSNNVAVKEWNATTGQVTTLPFSGLNFPTGITVVETGNVYVADYDNNTIEEWNATTGQLTTPVSTGLFEPLGVAVDGSGNIFIADSGDNAIKEWKAATGQVTTLPFSGLSNPYGVALDGSGNVFVADANNNAIKELVRAYVPGNPISETPAAGSDALAAVLPATQSLTAPFAPTSDQSWLTIGATANGVVNFSFTANTGIGSRTAHINLLGQQISVTQVVPALATYALLEGPAAGSDTDIVTISGSWTATSNASWLHTSAGGTGKGLARISFDANPGATRTGTLTIAGLTLTVSQAGSGYVTAFPVTTLVSSGPGDPLGATVGGTTNPVNNLLATGMADFPEGVAVDGSGNVYIADSSSNAIKEWNATTQQVTTLVSSGASFPVGVAVDATGNVFFVDGGSNSIKEWNAATGQVSTVVNFNLTRPMGVAVDGSGNVYIADFTNGVFKWNTTTHQLSFVSRSGFFEPAGVAVDTAGNVYVADFGNNAIEKWTAATQQVTTLVSGLFNPEGVAVDASGNVYIADTNNQAIKEWNASTGHVTTLTFGRSPHGVAVDGSGNVFIADTGNNAIKEWNASTQQVTTLPISGLYYPGGVAVDVAGNAFIADTQNNAIKEWNATTQQVSTLVSGLNDPLGVAVDGAGNVFVADTRDNAIDEWNATTGQVTTLPFTGLSGPGGVAVDRAGNVYVADTNNNAIKEWNATTGQVTTLVSTGLSGPIGVAVDWAGNVYIADYGNNAIEEWNATTQQVSTLSISVSGPIGVAVDGTGSIYITENGNNAIVEWNATTGQVTTLVSGPSHPYGVAVSVAGNVYIADTFNNAIKELFKAYVPGVPLNETAAAGSDALAAVLPATQPLTGQFAPTSDQSWLTIGAIVNGVVNFSFAANTGTADRTAHINLLGQQITVTQVAPALANYTLLEGPAAGIDYDIVADAGTWTAVSNASWLHTSAGGTGNGLASFSFDANPGATRTGTLTIAGRTLSVTQAGNGYVAANPLTTLVSSGLFLPFQVAPDGAGNLYIDDSHNNAIEEWNPTTQQVTALVSSGLNNPLGVAVDSSGNVFIADTLNNAIKEWNASTQQVTTLPISGLNSPYNLALDRYGNLFIADAGNSAIKEWNPTTQKVTTLVSSGLNEPLGLAVDGAGNLYIADTFNNAIKEWNATTGQVTTLVSSGLNFPEGVAVDGAGNVYIADFVNNAIKEWNVTTQQVTTIVSTGLNQPRGVAVDGNGNVYIVDSGNNAIKELVRAYVPGNPVSESGPAGSDALAVVLPTTQALTGVFAPTSDQSWLTIGATTNGVVNFSFTTNTGVVPRTGHINLLGQQITVTQQPGPALGSYNLLEGPASGSDSDIVLAGPWTATSNAGWLHTSASGTGSGLATFSFDANPGATRTGTLTIAGRTLSVTQAGNTYVAANPVETLFSSGLKTPFAVAVDGSGNVFIADSGNNAIKEWNASTGLVTTLVSTGLNSPQGVAVDGAGNIYIADTFNNAIKEWHASTGLVTTLVSSGLNAPKGVAVDGAGNVYIADTFNNAVEEWNATTGQLTTLVATGLNHPWAVAVDGAGNVYIADVNHGAVEEWNATTLQVTTLVSSGLSGGFGVAVDGSGNVYFAENTSNAIAEWNARTGQVTTLVSTGLSAPIGVAVDGAGNVYIADQTNNAIKELVRAYVSAGSVNETSAAGSDALAVLPTTQPLTGQFAPTSDQSWLTIGAVANGVVNFSFTSNTGPARTAHISLLGQQITVTQTTPTPTLGVYALVEGPASGSDVDLVVGSGAWTATSNATWLHTSASGAGNGQASFSFDANLGATRTGTLTIDGLTLTVTQAGSTYVAANPVTTLVPSGLIFPQGVAVDASGNVFIADSFNGLLKEWNATTGQVTTLASGLSGLAGAAVDASGNVYFSVEGAQTLSEWHAATGQVTTLASGIVNSYGVALDAAGDVFIADFGIKEWHAASGQVTNLPISGLNDPLGVAVDVSGNVYIADTFNNAIKEWNATTQQVTTLVSTGLNNPYGVAVDGSGNVYIADSNNNAIKEWNASTGQVTTLISSGLNHPLALAADGIGNVYIADTNTSVIRERVKAYVPGGPVNETAAAGSDALAVLPTTQSLTTVFTPTSDQSWLTIGTSANGVVNFTFTVNTGAAARTAHISLLGQQITVTQAAPASAAIVVTPYTSDTTTYDGNVHTATGTATGIGGVDLSGDLTLTGTTHTNAGTYTDTWTFHDPSGNYADASGTVDDSIAQASVAIVITPYTSDSTTYDGNSHTAAGTATGIGGVDLGGDLTLTGTTHTNAGTYTDTWTFHDPSGNYRDASGTVTDSIAQAGAAIVITPYTSDTTIYDGNTHTASGMATGINNEDLSSDLTLGGTTHTNAGTYDGDSWNFHDPIGNYADASGTVDDSIGQASAVIVVTPYTSATTSYDGAAHTATGTATGVNDEDLSSGLTLSATTHTNAGTYTDSWIFHDVTGNYQDVSGTITDSIAQASAVIVVTPYTSGSTIYDGTAHTATGTATGVNNEDLSSDLTLSGTAHTNAGTYTDSWSFHDATGNYQDANGTITDSIAQAQALIVITPYVSASTTYDGNAHTATGTATGIGGVDLSGDLTLNGTTHTNAGTYTDPWSFHDASGNYLDASGTITDSIAQASAAIVIAPYTSTNTTYDGNAHTATGTATGIGGVDLSGDLTLNGTTHTNAGTYSDGWNFHDAGGNYLDASGTVNDSIAQASLTIQATSDSKVYDGTTGDTAMPTFQVTGLAANTLFGSDTFTGLSQAFASKDVLGAGGSTLQVKDYTINDGNGGQNYSVTLQSATGTITPAALTITAAANTKVFDGTASASATPLITGGTVFGSDIAAFTEVYQSAKVGTGLRLTPHGVVNDGNGGADYRYTFIHADNGVITKATPTVAVTDAGGTYDGKAFSAKATVTGVSGKPHASLEGVAPTLSYYSLTDPSNPLLLNGAPTTVGAYEVDAFFAGSSDYSSAVVDALFAITKDTPALTVKDAGGTYNGNAFPATVTLKDVTGKVVAALENVAPTLTYYSGTYDLSSLPSSGGSTVAPANAGNYTVVASFAGSLDYAATSALANFTIKQVNTKLTVKDAGGTFNGNPFAATITLKDFAGTAVSSLEGVAPTLTYYSGTYDLNSLPSSGGASVAPTNAGAYTVVASFAGSLDYAATSALATFTIKQAKPTLTVKDSGGSHNGNPFPAIVTLEDVNGNVVDNLEGITPTLIYYLGTYSLDNLPVSGGSTLAPTGPGKYTVVAYFAGSVDYQATSAITHFTIK